MDMSGHHGFLADEAIEEGALCVLRADPRASMFLSAIVRRVAGGPDVTVKVRNLSAGGLMAEAPVPYAKGEAVQIELRGLGQIDARIAWTAGGRIGVSFDLAIDPSLARRPVAVAAGSSVPMARPARMMWRPGFS